MSAVTSLNSKRNPPSDSFYRRYCQNAKEGGLDVMRKGCHRGVYRVYGALRQIIAKRGKVGNLTLAHKYMCKDSQCSHVFTYTEPKKGIIVSALRWIFNKFGMHPFMKKISSFVLNSDLSNLQHLPQRAQRPDLCLGHFCDHRMFSSIIGYQTQFGGNFGEKITRIPRFDPKKIGPCVDFSGFTGHQNFSVWGLSPFLSRSNWDDLIFSGKIK